MLIVIADAGLHDNETYSGLSNVYGIIPKYLLNQIRLEVSLSISNWYEAILTTHTSDAVVIKAKDEIKLESILPDGLFVHAYLLEMVSKKQGKWRIEIISQTIPQGS